MEKIIVRVIQTEKPIAIVPLAGGEKGNAQIYLSDLQDLLVLGMSPKWNRLADGYVTTPAAAAPGNNVQVARAMMDAGATHRIRYVSFDKTDLRRENVLLVASYGSSRRDRDYLSGKDQSHRVEFAYV